MHCLQNTLSRCKSTNFTKGSFPIPKYIKVTHTLINEGKAYETISYDNQVSEHENFTNKAYPDSCSTKTYMPIKKKKGSNT